MLGVFICTLSFLDASNFAHLLIWHQALKEPDMNNPWCNQG